MGDIDQNQILNQNQIDELINALNNGTFQEWKTSCNIFNHNEVRFKYNDIYVIEDYELFYCNYPLERLTSCGSILRRYAYRDVKSFRQFKYFMVIEDYQGKGINAVSVVGILLDKSVELRHNYDYDRNNGIIYLTDASSLLYAYSFYDYK